MNQNSNKTTNSKKVQKRTKKAIKNKVKCVKYFLLLDFVVFERRCFGWHLIDHSKEIKDVQLRIDDDGYIQSSATVIKKAYFARPNVWQKNFLFSLTEVLAQIFIKCLDTPVALIYMPCVPLLAGFSLLFSLLGILWKRLFKLEEKTNEILVKMAMQNGVTTKKYRFLWMMNDGEFIL